MPRFPNLPDKDGSTPPGGGPASLGDALDVVAGATSTAQYISDMSHELRGMAEKAGLDLLAYLLEMVRIEAGTLIRKASEPR